MGIVTVESDVEVDYRGMTLENINGFVLLTTPSLSFNKFLLSSTQFGPGLASLNSTFSTYGAWRVDISVAPNATFSGAGFRLDNPSPILPAFGFTDGGSATREFITGSRYSDNITTLGGGDVIRAGAGSDVVTIDLDHLAANTILDGGDGLDGLDMRVNRDGGDYTVDFSTMDVTSFESLAITMQLDDDPSLEPDPISVDLTFTAAQFANVLSMGSAAQDTNITIKGNSIDLTGFLNRPQNTNDDTPAVLTFKLVGTGAAASLTGSAFGDTITAAGQGGGRMTGGLGADRLIGGAGRDTFVLTAIDTLEGDQVAGGGDIDTIEYLAKRTGDSFVSVIADGVEIHKFTGAFDSTLALQVLETGVVPTIVGSGARNTLSLTVLPLFRSDFSTVKFNNWSANDSVVITSSAGGNIKGTIVADSILGSAVSETLNGMGGNDTITGSYGNDTLVGGAGTDRLVGGPGDDTYVSPAGDTIIEAAGTSGGRDTIRSSITVNLGPIANVENVILTGSDAVNATGNALANELTGNGRANTLNGGTGNDTLEGAGGKDTLIGGTGDDTYVNPTGDVVTEVAGPAGGTHDRVESSVTFRLATVADVEDLTLTGTAAIDGIGTTGANIIIGNSGANVLNGGDGTDRLSGNGGNDTLLGGNGADRLNGGAGRDTINPGSDSNTDIIIAAGVSDSTSATRDLIVRADFDDDKFDIGLRPTSVSFGLSSDSLSEATFDADLTAIFDDGFLSANQAMVYAVSNGDLAGKDFLVIDANGVSGYQAGEDFVFQLQDWAGTLDSGDFILPG